MGRCAQRAVIRQARAGGCDRPEVEVLRGASVKEIRAASLARENW